MAGLFPDQAEVAVKFEEWLLTTNIQTCGLWASAGFGKSHMAKHLIEEVVLKNSNYIVVATSMTHSAVEVLSEFLGKPAMTLHSLMGWIPTVDKETGREGISTPRMRNKNAEDKLTKNMLVVIDEAGLIGHDELALLLEELNHTGARVLFIGDNKQCFPVIKDDQKLCVPAYDYTEQKFYLTIPKRVDQDDPIYKLSQAFRATVDGARQPRLQTFLNKDGSGKGVRHVDDIEEMAYLAFAAGKRDGNIRKIKVLAFTNIRCLNLNRKIRRKVLGLKDPTPLVGEEMVANTAIQTSTGDDVMIRNNQRLIVTSVEKTESHGMEGAFINFENEDGDAIEETVFVPASPGRLADRLKIMAREAKHFAKIGEPTEASKKWRAFYSLKEGCADIRYTYAMTVNKSQGVTLDHALVDLCDIDGCRDKEQKARLAYTAITRARSYLTIEGELT